MRALGRVAAMLVLGLLAAVAVPASGASAAGPPVRYELGVPTFEGRTWTFSPRAFDADDNDLGPVVMNPVFVWASANASASTQPLTTTLGARNVLMMIYVHPHRNFDVTLAILDVRFDLNGAPGTAPAGWSGDVYAEGHGVTLADAGIALAEPTRADYQFAGWNTAADGSGLVVDAGTDIFWHFTNSTTMTLYAQWALALSFSGPPAAAAAGSAEVFSVTGLGAVDGATLSTTDPAATIDQATREIVFRTPGTHTVTASLEGYVSAETEVLVQAGPADTLGITASAESVDQGGSLDFTVTAADAFDNPIAVDPADVQLSSSVPTDVIEGLRVTFPHASPHTITAAYAGIQTSIAVEVIPAASPAPTPGPVPPAKQIAATGATDGITAYAAAGALALLMAGGALLARASLVRARRAATSAVRGA